MEVAVKKERKWIIWGGTGILAVLLLVYLAGALYYGRHFYRGTTLNGRNLSGKSTKTVAKELSDYELNVWELAIDGSHISEVITAIVLGLDQDMNRVVGGIFMF